MKTNSEIILETLIRLNWLLSVIVLSLIPFKMNVESTNNFYLLITIALATFSILLFTSCLLSIYLKCKSNKKTLKWTDKLIGKFLRQRVYLWDLRYTDKEVEDKLIFRNLRGHAKTTYTDEDDENKVVQIIDTLIGNLLHYQIYNKLINLTPVQQFRLARKICAKDRRFRIKIGWTIKYLR